MKSTKRSLFTSIVALVLCFSMLLGTTFAWFTDVVTSGNNKIVAGNLKIDLKLLEDKGDSTEWVSIKNSRKPIFNHKNWEPGYTDVKILRIDNEGTLALKWIAKIVALDELSILADVIDVYFYSSSTPITQYPNARKLTELGYEKVGTLREFAESLEQSSSTPLLAGESAYIGIALHLSGENTGNEYKNLSCGEFDIKIFATQHSAESEKDSFDENYDNEAQFPVFKPANVSLSVKTENNLVTEAAYKKTGSASMSVPAGTKTTKNRLGLTVSEMATSSSNVTLEENEIIRPLDVHVDGVASDNTKAIIITLDKAMMTGLNIGNYKLYHVEDGVANLMTAVSSLDELDAHNEFYYDPATGNVSLAMATFSEVAVVAEPPKWEGNRDYSWYTNAVAPIAEGEADYVIANADQLAGFGAIVGGMAKDENGNFLITYTDSDGDEHHNDTFNGKIVKLTSDINLGDKDNANESLIFHPIGYYYTDDKNADGTKGDYYSTVCSFEGTFDGNGHTIANFYHNTWEIKGDYDGNYYSDAMGLFGYVVNGKVCNLTVDNFSSDGEFTPTGVIAAYAVNSTFENISITNCNPRVYNTGNGGIVGIGGNSNDPDTYKLTFTNITIDNSNIITALWGSWDVACGGLVGMFRGAGHVYMTNCHIGAQIDVYNDVCGNYQYYWYRYSGMMIGTNKNMITDKDGYTVPETSKFHAENCTVHFGDWNDYYYCELVANSLASYTHDHQFSRLTQIQNVSEIQDANGNWNKTGNYILMNGKTPTETCYHIMKDANGNLYEHKHNVADATNPNVNETVNGETVLKENNQRIYLPFNQLFTGYGWGVKHIPVYNGDDYAFEGITILDRTTADSKVKFEKADNAKDSYMNGVPISIGNLFKAANLGDEKLSILNQTVNVTVSPVGENSTVSGVYTANTSDWTQGTLTLSGTGAATITITDYYFCTPTTINVTVTERAEEEKFDVVMNNGDFLHRVGNIGTVSLDKLFKAKDGVTVGTVSVTVEAVNGTSASGTYSGNAIQFNGTGVVKVTITDNDYCIPTELYLEVVDAVNATGETNATKNNVVLLNDCDFSSLEVSGGYTLYGNGFTMTCGSDSAALNTGYEFVALNNGTLDNVQIVCPNFDYAVLYSSNMTEDANRSETTDKKRYFNVKSGVEVNGNSQILNSRISGARAAVNIVGGNCLIDNSRLEGGAVATLLIGSANSVTLRDVTLIQKPTASTYDANKVLMGFSVLTICDSEGNSAPITLEGTLVQNAWVDESDKKYVPSEGQSIVSTALGKTDYLHDIDGNDTKESLNLGFAYMPESLGSKVNTTTITDNRTNKATIPYDYAEVAILNGNTYVYSYKNSNGTNDSFKNVGDYQPNKYSDIITVNYSDTTDGLELGKSFGTSGWVYELNVDLDKASGYKLDFSKLSMTVNGTTVTDFKVNGSAKPTSPVAVTTGGVTYTLTATVNGKEYTATFKVIGTETSKDSPSLVGTPSYGTGFGVANSYNGDWSAAAPVLDGITIRYWSVADSTYKEFSLSSITFANTGKQNGTNSYWEYTHTNNDFTLKLTNTVAMHDKSQTFGMPVVGKDDGKLYFTIAGTGGFVSNGTSSRSITIAYEFTDNNGGEKLTFTHKFDISYNKDDQYNYNSFVKDGTLTKLESSSGGGCVTGDTLITLADGTQKRADEITYSDTLLVWNFFKGEYTTASPSAIYNYGDQLYKVTNLKFSDGTIVKMIAEHEFFDVEENSFVYMCEDNIEEFIGHKFLKMDDGQYKEVTLISYEFTEEYTGSYVILTAQHYNCFTEGMFSMTSDPSYKCENFFRIFEVGENMKFDETKMQADIEMYGLYTYEDYAAYVTYEEYIAFGGAYFKILVGKGLLKFEDILLAVATYAPNH